MGGSGVFGVVVPLTRSVSLVSQKFPVGIYASVERGLSSVGCKSPEGPGGEGPIW